MFPTGSPVQQVRQAPVRDMHRGWQFAYIIYMGPLQSYYYFFYDFTKLKQKNPN